MRIIFAIIFGFLLPTYSVGDPQCPSPPPGFPSQCDQCCHCDTEGESCPQLGFPRTAGEYAAEIYPQFYASLQLEDNVCIPTLDGNDPNDPSLNPLLGCQPFPAVSFFTGQPVCSEVKEWCPQGSGRSRSSTHDDEPFCAYQFFDDCGTYRFFEGSRTAAEKNPNVFIIHDESCGVCSFAQDLAANMNPFLDCEAFKCILQFASDQNFYFEGLVACYGALGFSNDCAFLWASNAFNTVLSLGDGTPSSCQDCDDLFDSDAFPDPDTLDCMNLVGNEFPAPNDPITCELSACLQCDETVSGPDFKKFSGLTRRRAGIVTAEDLSFGAGVYWAGTKRECDSIADIQLEICI